MSDYTDEIPVTDFAGISIIPRGDGFVIAFVDEDGNVIGAYPASRNRLTKVFGYIGEALKPGLLGQLYPAG